VGPGAVLDLVVKRKIPSPRRESKPRTLIILPVGQRFNLKYKKATCGVIPWYPEAMINTVYLLLTLYLYH
jgi:hypothetical protein